MARKPKDAPEVPVNPRVIQKATQWVETYHMISFAFPTLPVPAVIAATDYVMASYV